MYPNLTPYLVALLGVALAGTVAMAARHAFLRRLAVRQIARRRGEAALVVAGSVLGTAIIVGSLLVGDTMTHSIRRQAWSGLGPIDEVVTTSGGTRGAEVAGRLARLGGDPDVDGLLVLTGDRAGVAHGRGAGRKAEPRANLFETDFGQAAGFGGRGSNASGLTGPAPRAGELVLNGELAKALDAAPGDVVTVWLYGQAHDLRVARVVPAEGVAAGGAGVSRGAFLAPGTLAGAAKAAGAAAASAGPKTFVYVSNAGGVEGGSRRSDAVGAKLDAAVAPAAHKDVTVEKVKQQALRDADQAGNELGSFFLFVGCFAIIAGVMLLVNIFVMLAEERKPELGVLRAVGVRRAVVEVAARILASISPDEGGLDLSFHVTPTSLVNGFALGFLIAFLTVALTSVRISRLNVIAAIRDLGGDGGRRLKWRWVALSTLASLAVLGWGLAANTLRPKVFDDGSTATFVVLGTVLVFSAVVLVSQNQELLTRPLRPLIARPSPAGLATRLGVAYPVAGRFRTGAILIMYGLVVFTLVLITVLGSIIQSTLGNEVANASGGFALRADFKPSAKVADPAAAFGAGRFAGRVAAVAPLSAAKAKVSHFGRLGDADVVAVGATAAIVQGRLFLLQERLAGLGDDRAVWRRVFSDLRYVIADRFLRQEEAGPSSVDYHPGDTLTLTDPSSGKAERKTIAGTLRSAQAFYGIGLADASGGPVILGQGALAAQFGTAAKASSALVAPAAGTSDQSLTADLQGEFLPASLVVTQVRREVEREFAANRSFFQLMEGFLALGLLVGIAGLGVVMVRAVRERRRTIGVLRALGFQ